MSEKYKELYNYELPLDLDFEWSKIEKKLEKKEKKRRFVWWFFPGVSVFALILFASFLFTQNIDKNKSISNQLVHEVEVPKTTLDHMDVKATQPYEIVEKQINKENLTKSSDVRSKPKTELENEFKVKKDSAFKKGLSISKSELILAQNNTVELGRSDIRIEHESALKSIGNANSFELQKSLQIKSEKAQNVIAKLPMIKEFINCNTCDLNIHLNYAEFSPKEKEIQPSTLAFSGQVMYGLADRKLSENSINSVSYIEQRNKTEVVLDVMKMRTMLEYSFADRWSISGGLDFTRITEKFSYVGMSEETVNENDAALEIYTDFEGNVTTTAGEKTTTKVYDINILKYNHFSSINIPLELGYRLPLNKSSILFSSGIVVPLSGKYKGTIFNENGGLSQLENTPYSINNKIRFCHGVLFNYHYNERLIFSGGLYVEYGKGGGIKYNEYAQSYQMLATNIGVRYQIN